MKPAFLFVVIASTAFAGSATWNLNPTSSDWNTAANWTPATVPDGPDDAATFSLSNQTSVSNSTGIRVKGIIFDSGASSYTITLEHLANASLVFRDDGITNRSGQVQNFVTTAGCDGSHATIQFTRNSSAGSQSFFTNQGGHGDLGSGSTIFFDHSTAGQAMFVNEPACQTGFFEGGTVTFYDDATRGIGGFYQPRRRCERRRRRFDDLYLQRYSW